MSPTKATLVVSGDIDIPVTYRYACRYQPPHLRLVSTYLRRRYDVAIDDRMSDGMFDRYCGDAGTVAKGEILRWVRE